MDGAPECIFEAVAIAARVRQLGREIRSRARERSLVLLGVLQGACLFTVDLARALGPPLELAFVQARSYGAGTVSRGRIEVGEMETALLRGATVLVADTVLDSGRTLAELCTRLRELGAAEVWSCVLVEKDAPRAAAILPDFVGFRAPGHFLVGYGLDAAGLHRALPYIAAVEDRGR
ncbi:MAG: phosphoribosyltransferase [Planctomycetaceae bacterium]